MNTLSAEQEVARLVARAKRDKEEAKDRRDDGDIATAVKVLEETVKALSASPLAAGLETAAAPSEPMCDLAAQLADCLGMLGGNYRRQGRFEDAQAAFERGRVYEESPSLEVMSSYNLVNAITLPIESDGQAWTRSGRTWRRRWRRSHVRCTVSAATTAGPGPIWLSANCYLGTRPVRSKATAASVT